MSAQEPSHNVRVLVVDDEREVADAYALRLRGFCEVQTAYGGRESLSIIEDSAIDIVLLDRHMPNLSGDDVLQRLKAQDFEGRVVMVTAVDPGFEVLEMPFDDYLCKPVDQDDIRAVIDQQRKILAFDTLGKYFRGESKRTVLAHSVNRDNLRENEKYVAMVEQTERLRKRVRRLLPDESILEEFDQISREEY